jgi:hypothetical protein
MGGVVRRAVLLVAAMAAVGVMAVGSSATAVHAAEDGLTLSASSARLGAGRTSVVLRGTYSCGPFASGLADRGVIDLTVQQVRWSGTVTAYGYLEPTVCDGDPQSYAVTLTGTGTGRFTTGPAIWSGSGYVEGDGGLQHVHVGPSPITITR